MVSCGVLWCSKYGYVASHPTLDGSLRLAGTSKVDLATGKVLASMVYGNQVYGGELVFVPASTEEGGEEDDGFLVGYIHDEAYNASYFIVLDASVKGDNVPFPVVSKVLLPNRYVP